MKSFLLFKKKGKKNVFTGLLREKIFDFLVNPILMSTIFILSNYAKIFLHSLEWEYLFHIITHKDIPTLEPINLE